MVMTELFKFYCVSGHRCFLFLSLLVHSNFIFLFSSYVMSLCLWQMTSRCGFMKMMIRV